jgi:squalene-associated FAD-dependent desaturase
MDQELTPHVAIIGGGCAGLSAACQLSQHGIPVTVYESSHQLGGRARGLTWNGLRLDNGQHILLGAYEATLALLGQIGIKANDVLHRQPLNLQVLPDFSLATSSRLPAPLHILSGMMTAKGLTWADRFSALRLMAILRMSRFRLQKDMPLADFLQLHRQPPRLIQYLWEPLCLAALNTPLSVASSQIYINVLRDSFSKRNQDSDLIFPKLDLSHLIADPAAAYVQGHGGTILTGTPVLKIQRKNTGFELTTESEQRQRHSHVVIATQPFRAGDLLGEFPECMALSRLLADIDYQPIYTVYLQYEASRALPGIMLGLGNGLVQWVFDRGGLYGQPGLMAVIISAEGKHQQITQTALAEQVQQELASYFPHLGKPLWHKVIAEKRATFSCRHDLQRPPAETSVRNLYLAGDYVAGDYPATIEGAIRHGHHVAERIRQSIRTSP